MAVLVARLVLVTVVDSGSGGSKSMVGVRWLGILVVQVLINLYYHDDGQ